MYVNAHSATVVLASAVEHFVNRRCYLVPTLLLLFLCRVDDYWLGYKLFCYAYYSRSVQHEAAFRGSKLGRLVWRRLAGVPRPSHHAIRATCTQILPLVEMWCKWELQEECGDLHALMVRFDSERELETHELGRSLLGMLRDEQMGLQSVNQADVVPVRDNPFDLIRDRLAAAEVAIRDLQPQVSIVSDPFCTLEVHFVMLLAWTPILHTVHNVILFEL